MSCHDNPPPKLPVCDSNRRLHSNSFRLRTPRQVLSGDKLRERIVRRLREKKASWFCDGYSVPRSLIFSKLRMILLGSTVEQISAVSQGESAVALLCRIPLTRSFLTFF